MARVVAGDERDPGPPWHPAPPRYSPPIGMGISRDHRPGPGGPIRSGCTGRAESPGRTEHPRTDTPQRCAVSDVEEVRRPVPRFLSMTFSAITFLSWPCCRGGSTGNANANALAACLPAGAMLGSCTDGICIPIDGLSGTMPRLHSSHWRCCSSGELKMPMDPCIPGSLSNS